MIATCPTDQRLQQFTLGHLNEEQSDLLFSHVSDCPDCQNRLGDEATEDTLVGRLRETRVDRGGAVQAFEKESECQAAMSKALAALTEVHSSEQQTKLPEKIGDYEILRLIGRGGMGNVYLAKHVKLGRQVALKVIASHRSDDPMMQGRFAKEMQAVGTLNHPNVVAALDAREVDGLAILVTEWIDGLNLSEIIYRIGPIEPANAAEVVRQVAEALTAIDQAGLVHRDIKPSNIMLTSSGQVKLLDLGLARLQGDGTHREFTMTGQAIGTVDYVAPEQIQGSDSIDIRTDLYGLGCTLFKMLTGRVPFDGPEYSTSFAKMNAHVSAERPIVQRAEVPKELSALTEQMMAKEASDRPSSTRSVSERAKQLSAKSDLSALIGSALSDKNSYCERQLKPTLPAADSTSSETGNEVLPWWRRQVPIWAAISGGLFGAIIGCCLGIIITIQKPDGTTAHLEVPDNATVTIDSEGNPTVKIADNGVPAAATHANLDSSLPKRRKQNGNPTGPGAGGGSEPLPSGFVDAGPGSGYDHSSSEPLLNESKQDQGDPVLSFGYNLDPVDLSTSIRQADEDDEMEQQPANLPFPDSGLDASSAELGQSRLKGIWRMEVFVSQRSRGSQRLNQRAPNWIVFSDSKVALFRKNTQYAKGSYTLVQPSEEGVGIVLKLELPDQTKSEDVSFWAPSELTGYLKSRNDGKIVFDVRSIKGSSGTFRREDDIIFRFEKETIVREIAGYPSLATTGLDSQAAVLAAYQFEMEGKPLPAEAKELIHQLRAKEKVRQIVLAMHNYHDVNKRLPASQITIPLPSKTVRTTNQIPKSPALPSQSKPHSWRVALLPYLGYQDLYNQYKFDEAWDSANNKKLLSQMPSVYRSPSDTSKEGNTYFLGIVGPNAAIGIEQGFSLVSITDGTSNTIIVAEARDAVRWTKPADVHFQSNDLFAPRKSWFRMKDAAVAFADGSVGTMQTHLLDNFGKQGIPLHTLKAFLTRDGKELVSPLESELFKK